MGSLCNPDPALTHYVEIAIPFSYQLSKNAIYGNAGGGHRFIRPEVNRRRDEVAWMLKADKRPWFEGPIWLSIHVEKTNHKGDAINVVTTLADAIKHGIGIDDRWFSIARLDWSIVKVVPRVLIGIGQYVTEDHRACSYCGSIVPLTDFRLNRTTKSGRDRKCNRC